MYEKFEALLKARGVSIYAVAKATGILSTTLYAWRDKEYKPKVDKLQKIANYFGVDVTYFLETEPQK